MFRKLISNVNYSPALVGQLGFYAKRLKREEATRRLGLVFTALALVVQSFAVFSPPEAANAASAADFVAGGVSSPAEFVRHYDRNTRGIRDIFNSLGITRAEIANTKRTTVREPGHYNWSMTSLYSHAQGQRTWNYGKGKVYYRPMTLTQQGGPNHVVFAGYSKTFGWFAIKKDCGNLVTKKPPHRPNPSAVCQNMNISRISDTRFKVSSKANKKQGAEIRSYDYVITKDGKKVFGKSFKTSKEQHSFTYTQANAGTYKAQLTVRTSVGPKTGADCRDSFVVSKKPTAVCVSANASVANRTIVTLTGQARTSGGATVKRYDFVVKNQSGGVVKRVSVTSNKLDVTAESFTLSSAGTYKVELTVVTSLGNKTGADCAKQFTIVKPEVCPYNPSLPKNSPDCQPCPENPDIWVKDEECSAEIIQSKTSTNLTQNNVQASTVTAKSGDKLSYTLTAENRGQASETVTIRESLDDVLEYSKLVDTAGGIFDKETNTLSWPAVVIKPGERQSRTIVVEMLKPLPTTNTGKSNQDSYDCKMVNTYGNAIEVNVDCAPEKVVVEQVVSELPETGPTENMIFAATLLSIVTFFYARSRQLGREVRLVRRGLNAGTI